MFFFNHKMTYLLTQNSIGFAFLEYITNVLPTECSGYYFACRKI